MDSLVIRNGVADQFRALADDAIVRDEDGKIVGVFRPLHSTSGQTRSTREVLERLLPLTTDEPTRAHLLQVIKEVAEREQCGTP